MRCAPARRLLTARRGRQLRPTAADALEGHLRDCPACAADAAAEEAIAQLLGAGRGDPVPPVDVRARVLAGIDELAAPAPKWAPWWRMAGPALAAGGILAVIAALAAWVGPAAAESGPQTGLLDLLARGAATAWVTFLALAEAVVRTGGALSETLLSLVPAHPRLFGAWSFAFGALGHLAAATMLGACAWWIGRDLLRPAHGLARGEDSR